MLTKYKRNDTPWGRVHLQPHPVMAAELAYFLQDVVLYVNTYCQIESLTLGPREGRLALDLMPSLDDVPWMEYWKASPQNPTGLTKEDINQEARWQLAALEIGAIEGNVVPSLVHSALGRTVHMNCIHTLSKCQFKNTPIVAGANVTMLETVMDNERRDRQTDLDLMMMRETEGTIMWLGQNVAFRQGVESVKPIVIPGGFLVSTTQAYAIAGGPDLHVPQTPATPASEVPLDETQAPAVEPWPSTGPPEPDEPPPPPPPFSMAPTESHRVDPPPPPPAEERGKNKMPKEGGASGSRGRWKRESGDQTGLGGTPAGPGHLTLPPVNPDPLNLIPSVLREPQHDPTDGEGIVSLTLGKPEIKKEATGPERGPKRGLLKHVFENCASSCPAARNHDDYGLPVPQLNNPEDTPGVLKSFDSQDVWRCYASGFTGWKDYEDMYDTWKKIKQVAKTTQFWDRPPGAMTPPNRLDYPWTSKQIGRGREYVTLEKCWCMYPKPDGDVNMGLWVCVQLDPEAVEPSPDDSPFAMDATPVAEGARTEEGVRGTDANSIVAGYGVRQNNAGWVNAIAFDLSKLSRRVDNSFICSWAGFDKEYYENAQAKGERNDKFGAPFFMQLVSDEYLHSQIGVSFQGSEGELQMGFSTDKAVTPRDESGVGARETLTPEGGVARMATSSPAELQPLGDPLVEDILPPETPNDECVRMILKNHNGDVAEIKSKKPIEIITDLNDPLVAQWMAVHGTKGTPGYLFWGWAGRDEKNARNR